MERILITGAAGFIGGKLAKKYEDNPNNVVYLCDKRKSNLSNYFEADLTNYADIENCLQKVKPDIIFHCAGNADVYNSVINPQCDFDSNVVATNNLILSLIANKMFDVKIVFLSSAAVYGNPVSIPMNEDSESNPLSPYALHKMMCEQMLLFYSKNYGFDIKIARIFSCYGEGLKKQILWDMYTKYKKYGKLCMLGTGKESRDYIHINDVINCLILLSKDKSSEIIFNICNNEETRIETIVKLFAKNMNICDSLISFSDKSRSGDPTNWCGNNTKIKNAGYTKTIELDNGIKKYCEWLDTIE